jgi:hypothetical protein
MASMMYEYSDHLFGSLPAAKQLVNINARMLTDQQSFAQGFGTFIQSLDRSIHDGFIGLHNDLSQGFAGADSHIDSMGQQISGQTSVHVRPVS